MKHLIYTVTISDESGGPRKKKKKKGFFSCAVSAERYMLYPQQTVIQNHLNQKQYWQLQILLDADTHHNHLSKINYIFCW